MNQLRGRNIKSLLSRSGFHFEISLSAVYYHHEDRSPRARTGNAVSPGRYHNLLCDGVSSWRSHRLTLAIFVGLLWGQFKSKTNIINVQWIVRDFEEPAVD